MPSANVEPIKPLPSEFAIFFLHSLRVFPQAVRVLLFLAEAVLAVARPAAAVAEKLVAASGWARGSNLNRLLKNSVFRS